MYTTIPVLLLSKPFYLISLLIAQKYPCGGCVDCDKILITKKNEGKNGKIPQKSRERERERELKTFNANVCLRGCE